MATLPLTNPTLLNNAYGNVNYTGNGYVGAGGTGSTISAATIQTPIVVTRNGMLNVLGDAEFEGKIKVNGKDLGKILSSIEERLALLHPNPELESRWEELADLRMKYMELEREIIEKEKIWAILNK